ncbi:MAG TPA: hypothetical protein VKP60_14580 [Magnetospirillaceae bacterium]|jgi:hypothetical protein|nr:hypothetical protein [Magnetospirillaceae bacterium]
MSSKTETLNRTDDASALRQQLSRLVKEVRCTIADPARPQGLKDALAQSQQMLR